MPYIKSPPMRSSRSKTVTLCPNLLSSSAHAKPAGPEPITAIFLFVRNVRRIRLNPAFCKRSVNYRNFDFLNHYRLFIDAENARRFARRGTNSARKFGEIIGQPRDFCKPRTICRDKPDRSIRESNFQADSRRSHLSKVAPV